MNNQLQMHINSPFLESFPLLKHCGRSVYIKMDSFQPSGSFKIRGLGHLISKKVSSGVTHLVSASGGNAGMATAYAGRMLNIPVSVIIPQTTHKLMIPLLEAEGANVLIHGKVWDEANEKAIEMGKMPGSLYVAPFDHELVWEGNESIIYEVLDACPEEPAAIVCCVGGGGLLCGILQGLIKKGLKIPVIAMETEGANSFNEALKAGKPVNIGKITSIATTLGALSVTPRVFDLLPESDIISRLIPDSLAVDACAKFVDDHRTLVEPSCGAALSAAYSGIISKLISDGKIKGSGPVIFIVCGGNAVTLELLKEWQQKFPVPQSPRILFDKPLHIETPLVESHKLSELCGRKTYLKMECCQVAGSFKMRGIGNFIKKNLHKDIKHLVIISAGNAGLATLYIAKKMGIPVSVVVPDGTAQLYVSKLEAEGATVKAYGKTWTEHYEKALEIVKATSGLFIHPYDHELVWEGNETIVEEILMQSPSIPSVIVCCAGGGGLLCGIMQAIQRKKLEIPVVVMETFGAHCVNRTLEMGKSLPFNDLTSLAKTLAAPYATPRILDLHKKSKLISRVVKDRDAVGACLKFADDHRVLVEPAAGAALTAGYSGIMADLFKAGELKGDGPVVFIVCGGNGVTISQLEKWKDMVGL